MPVKFNVKTRIKVNGIEYSSPDEMPEDVRAKYEKALAQRGLPNTHIKSSSKITFNGQTFNSAEEMPPDIRRIYESVMDSMDRKQDELSNRVRVDDQLPEAFPKTAQHDSVIAPSVVDKRLVIAGIVIIIAVLALGVMILALLSRAM